jgi:pilus assembly protein CpaC
MARFTRIQSAFAAIAMTAASCTSALMLLPATAAAQSAKDGRLMILSIGRGQQVNLGSNITDVVVADPAIADVEVKSGHQIYILGKGPGETTVFATDAAGRNIFQATVRVGSNMDSIAQMLTIAMPESQIVVTTMNGVVLLTGTVGQPESAPEVVRAHQRLRHRWHGHFRKVKATKRVCLIWTSISALRHWRWIWSRAAA